MVKKDLGRKYYELKYINQSGDRCVEHYSHKLYYWQIIGSALCIGDRRDGHDEIYFVLSPHTRYTLELKEQDI
jgi:hypothetical protein